MNSNQDIKSIFIKYYKPLVVFANTYVSNLDECEDVVQNVFLKLWNVELVFPNETALRAYLYRAVKNMCLNSLKHSKVKEIYKQENKIEEEAQTQIENEIIENESAQILYEAIKTLHPRKKRIIELVLKGVSNNDIAEQLSVKLNTVKSLKYKAYKSLRAYLENIPT